MLWALLLIAAAPAPADDRPYVEISASLGALDGAPGATWQRVRVDLHVKNHLTVAVDQLAVSVDLVAKDEGSELEPIAGWKFEQVFSEPVIEAQEESVLRIDRSLPARRRVHNAGEINYRVKVLSYRVLPPSLDLAVLLLESSDWGDQRAALQSWERLLSGGAPPGSAEIVAQEIAKTLAAPPRDPTPASALRLLIALRAAGDLGVPSFIPLLLSLPEKVRAPGWKNALAELSSKMIEASSEGEPRLEVLPAPSSDLISTASREAILRLGDRAVPELVRAASLGESDGIRGLAASVLAALGRGTVRSQLSIHDRDARRRLIDVYGEIGSPEPVPALAEIVAQRSSSLCEPATASLVRIGAPAIQPLVAALASPDKNSRRAILEVIEKIGARVELDAAARRYGVSLSPSDTPRAAAEKLADHLAAGARARWSSELARAMSAARAGDYDEAFRSLDVVYAADPELYLQNGKAIARLYLQRAQQLYLRGNYDSAIDTLRVGRTIDPLPEMDTLMRETELTLARGYLALDQIDRAEESLESAESLGQHHDIRALRARVLARKAELSRAAGDYGRARAEIDRARALMPDDEEVRRVNRSLSLDENIPILLVLSLMVPGGALSVVLILRRRAQAARWAQMVRD